MTQNQSPTPKAYLNGAFLPLAEAQVPVLDRGFLFGDGVYEVIPIYGGRPLRLKEHLVRLSRSLEAIGMSPPLDESAWAEIIAELVEGAEDQQVYIQVTRGPQPKRDHTIPAVVSPTVFAMCTPIAPIPVGGIAAVTVEDLRWDRCDIKAITLLANILLRQRALDQGATEAIIVRDGSALEGAASNLFVVRDGALTTPPNGPTILPGITRDLVIEVARGVGLSVTEETLSLDDLMRADEIWLTSSTREILPVIALDGRPVGSGEPGPVWRRVLEAYQVFKSQLRKGLVTD